MVADQWLLTGCAGDGTPVKQTERSLKKVTWRGYVFLFTILVRMGVELIFLFCAARCGFTEWE